MQSAQSSVAAVSFPVPFGRQPHSLTGKNCDLFESDAYNAAVGSQSFPSATVTLLDSSNAVVNKFNPIAVSFGASQNVNISLQVNGISAFPQAVMASLILIDSQGISSTAVTADFSHGDPGAAVLTSASYDGAVLLIKGNGFIAPVQVEMNGTVVAPPARAKVKGDTKIKIPGSTTDLNLKSGFNRLRVIENSLRSNLFVFSN